MLSKAAFLFPWLLKLPPLNHAASAVGGQLLTHISPDEGVEFKRVEFSTGETKTDWGGIFIEQARMPRTGFINVFGNVVMASRVDKAGGMDDKRNENAAAGSDANTAKWMVRNVRVNDDICGDLAPIIKYRLNNTRSSKPANWMDPCDENTKAAALNKTSLFHLGRVVDDSTSLSVAVVLTTEPLYKGRGSIQRKQLRKLGRHTYSLEDSIAMSDFEYATTDEASEVRATPTALPSRFKKEKPGTQRGPGEYDWYKQIPEPNIETASMQCVPMAFANILQFLEDSFPGFELEHEHEPGSCGNPYYSMVANLDDFMDRKEGKGLGSKKDAMEGFLNYLLAHTSGNIVVIHQGTPFEVFSSTVEYIQYGMIKSFRVDGQHPECPTFDFICHEIQRGHGVFLWYGRYSVNEPSRRELRPPPGAGGAPRAGDRHGGHAVRVVGCGIIGNENRLMVVHDKHQGVKGGTVEWELNNVEDYTGDHYLNFEGLATRKVELVVSMERLPKSCAPDEKPPDKE